MFLKLLFMFCSVLFFFLKGVCHREWKRICCWFFFKDEAMTFTDSADKGTRNREMAKCPFVGRRVFLLLFPLSTGKAFALGNQKHKLLILAGQTAALCSCISSWPCQVSPPQPATGRPHHHGPSNQHHMGRLLLSLLPNGNTDFLLPL